jgi:hypothetical protein
MTKSLGTGIGRALRESEKQIGEMNGQAGCAGARRGGSLAGLSYSNAGAKRCDSVLLSSTQRIRAVISERGAAIC